jgi:hypothetical protein
MEFSNSNSTIFGFSIFVLIATCKGTSIFLIQVRPSNFTALKIMSRKIFGEFMVFFSQNFELLLNSNQFQFRIVS